MTREEARQLPFGLYVLAWKDGGESLAAVGQTRDGTPWFAATNWISGNSTDWSMVAEARMILEHADLRAARDERVEERRAPEPNVTTGPLDGFLRRREERRETELADFPAPVRSMIAGLACPRIECTQRGQCTEYKLGHCASAKPMDPVTKPPPGPPPRCILCHESGQNLIQWDTGLTLLKSQACVDGTACLERRRRQQPYRCTSTRVGVQGHGNLMEHALRCDKREGHEGGHFHFCMFDTRVNGGHDTAHAGEKIEW